MATMHEKESKSSTPVLIAVVLVLFLLLTYVSGYLLLGRREWMPGTNQKERIIVFEQMWEVYAFRPMTFVERKITGTRTHVGTDDVYGTLSE